jgi:ABC-type sugar transport system substrate-binding protein
MRLTTKLSMFLVLALMLIGPMTVGGGTPAAAQEDEGLRFVFVTHDLGAGIFAPVRSGMEDACALVGATCEFLGPQTYDPAQQVSILEAAIATNPDGIATTRPEPGVYDDVIMRAQEAGIQVVTFNTNDPTADEVAPAPFVGQNFTNYGQVWAREVMRAMPDGGTLAITNCCPGHFALEERIRSFTETLEAEGEGKYEILETIITGADESEVFGAIEAFYAANPDVNMITGVDYYSNIIAQFIKNNDLQGKLLAGGSDLAPAQVDGLREGYVAFGLGQNPYLQGFYPVMIMHQAIEYGIRPITIDTGTDVVTPENVEEYNPEFR